MVYVLDDVLNALGSLLSTAPPLVKWFVFIIFMGVILGAIGAVLIFAGVCPKIDIGSAIGVKTTVTLPLQEVRTLDDNARAFILSSVVPECYMCFSNISDGAYGSCDTHSATFVLSENGTYSTFTSTCRQAMYQPGIEQGFDYAVSVCNSLAKEKSQDITSSLTNASVPNTLGIGEKRLIVVKQGDVIGGYPAKCSLDNVAKFAGIQFGTATGNSLPLTGTLTYVKTKDTQEFNQAYCDAKPGLNPFDINLWIFFVIANMALLVCAYTIPPFLTFIGSQI